MRPDIPRCERPAELVDGLARYAGLFPADRTNYSLGRLLQRLGWREKPDVRKNAEYASTLVPAGAAYTAAHLRLFLDTVGAGG